MKLKTLIIFILCNFSVWGGVDVTSRFNGEESAFTIPIDYVQTISLKCEFAIDGIDYYLTAKPPRHHYDNYDIRETLLESTQGEWNGYPTYYYKTCFKGKVICHKRFIETPNAMIEVGTSFKKGSEEEKRFSLADFEEVQEIVIAPSLAGEKGETYIEASVYDGKYFPDVNLMLNASGIRNLSYSLYVDAACVNYDFVVRDYNIKEGSKAALMNLQEETMKSLTEELHPFGTKPDLFVFLYCRDEYAILDFEIRWNTMCGYISAMRNRGLATDKSLYLFSTDYEEGDTESHQEVLDSWVISR